MESTDLIPMDGDVAKITRKAEEFNDLHDALQRNLQVYLPLTMDSLAAVHQSVKASAVTEATRQMVSPADVCWGFLGLTFLPQDSDLVEEEIEVVDGVCRDTEISDVARRVFISGKVGRRD